ncbi:xylose isomerase [Caldimonas thermodepolymerans]|jgi:xylose isomerase|uniref:Xylose isomerase n=1 Tax=Caldimonas thermodepolymerans TaxID=215580 RepID=A0A2S5T3E8_9BURK|nr:xylose isomerase [Caldimonas thermodepolymerans]PPE69449.1 xylose isomerase [Caldimonas thermodepolymerans]QPC32799.1 xylose isomerase [Caldimonas thermodepolymerans]RDI03568.1 D-xylose isomerase [Caldimonas thermodepolymerans]TCP09478.1 D-xylose isomerase [Caldimonas thermodepolymerans]UZG45665.1 xylose isomerase [Caldimonas thermodepolymerans]
MTSVFSGFGPIRYEGPDSRNPLAYRWYDAKRVVLGKTLEEHLRPAVCYWHSFCWRGEDPFALATPLFRRPWFDEPDPMQAARLKMDAAFDLFTCLGVPFWCFHDRDVAPEGTTLRESNARLDQMLELAARKMQDSGVRLLWGTANLFTNPRYMAGAATNPDPEVYAYAAAQVKHVLEWTHRLGGANYVLWGGREGYETLLNTDLKRELDHYGRFLAAVVEHKHKIGFKGTILVEPKPQEPTKHQYDYDTATVYGFLKRYGLEDEVKVNIEVNHATLAGHSFEHEVAVACALGIFGSIDANRGDEQLGWDTDQFPNNHVALVPALLEILRAGGFTTGGMNFDAKVRRQSIDPQDLIEAHIGGLDTLARALLSAAALYESQELCDARRQRYAGWDGELGRRIEAGAGLDELAALVHAQSLDPQPVSGRQERLENLVNRYV